KFSHIGIVIQAYLRRSEDDVTALAAEGANVRVCKGIYNEPSAIAFKGRGEIQQNFIRLLKILFNAKCRTAIATHDDVLIDAASQIIQEMRLTPQEYEFQMLLGVRSGRRAQLVEEGHRLRVYTPFGKQWYAYSIRRLKENPQIAGYVFRAMFRRNSFEM
ncbi:MAG: proline dehydrogenase family protein, partial [Bacteroidota bacterium]|nr:proline dehydrogenase family protein [Bacteroidota bacterium]